MRSSPVASCRCVVRNVPYDPELYFYGEEISLSARLWTHGYNIYTPNDLVLFHLYKTSSAEELHNTHWNDHHDWFESNDRRVLAEQHAGSTSVAQALVS